MTLLLLAHSVISDSGTLIRRFKNVEGYIARRGAVECEFSLTQKSFQKLQISKKSPDETGLLRVSRLSLRA